MAMKHPIDEPEPSKSNAMKEAASSLGLPVIDIRIAKPNSFVVYVVVRSVRYEGYSIHGIYDSLELAQTIALEQNASKYTSSDMTYNVIDWVINTTR